MPTSYLLESGIPVAANARLTAAAPHIWWVENVPSGTPPPSSPVSDSDVPPDSSAPEPPSASEGEGEAATLFLLNLRTGTYHLGVAPFPTGSCHSQVASGHANAPALRSVPRCGVFVVQASRFQAQFVDQSLSSCPDALSCDR